MFHCKWDIAEKIILRIYSKELTHLIDSLPDKIKCCFVLKEKNCKMSPIVFGHTKGVNIMYESLEFKNNKQIAKIIQAKCRTFLEIKYNEI